MVYTFEIIGTLFILVMFYFTYLEFKRQALSKLETGFWSLFWVGGLFLIVFNRFVNKLLPTLNIVRTLDLYMILGFMFLFAVVFYLFLIGKRAEKRIEKLTRLVALKPLKEKVDRGR
ncbi:MAG: DUF2304 domain-containing protein [Proteobacteria bacterium]|nr:DUF2304 domain-containing protein [Pseudomonadota bacterium]